LPQTIFPKYQKWKLKKLELFVKVLYNSSNDLNHLQVTLAKWRDTITPSNILNVDGAQTKMISIEQSSGTEVRDTELDILRIACFYPPIVLEGTNPTGVGNADAYLSTTTFMDGELYNQAHFNAFAIQFTAGSNLSGSESVSCVYYYKSTWLASNPSFEAT